MKLFTEEARAVVATAIEFAKELHYDDVGREHLLLGFASGAGGKIIRSAFERRGLTVDAVRKAIVYIDGPKRPVRPHHVKYVHQIHTVTEPYVEGFMALTANQVFVGLTPNADCVFKMALNEAIRGDVAAEDVLRIFLRELGRTDDDRRVMQVIDRAVPSLSIDQLKSSMIESLSDSITEQEAATDALKNQRMEFSYNGHLQGA